MTIHRSSRVLEALACCFGLAVLWSLPFPAAAQEAERDTKEEPAGQKGRDPLAPLPRDRLPPRTRVPPDPEKAQFQRDAVFVRVGEVIVSSKGETILPDVQVVDTYLQEYLRRAGFRIVTRPGEARYRVEGDLQSEYDKDLKVQGRTVAYKVRAECSFFVLDREGNELESFDIPEVYQENVRSEESAFLQLRRYVAKLAWDRLRQQGEVLGDPGVARLLTSLCLEGASPRGEPPTTAEGVIEELVDRGLEVVPFMIEALTDTRSVLAPSSYPGFTEERRGELKVYHVADKVLEEIFQKVSRMSLETPPEGRFRIMTGWEQEWRRFCPPFRESPHAPSRAKKSSAKKSG